MSPVSSTTSGSESAAETQRRRVMSRSSGLSSSVAAGTLGSSAIPQIGQVPGASRTIWGCMGHTHSVFRAGSGSSGSRISGGTCPGIDLLPARPHFAGLALL
jgi:hypothetical protein